MEARELITRTVVPVEVDTTTKEAGRLLSSLRTAAVPAAADMLVADLYELSMAAGYYRRGMVAPATFSLFARRLPDRRGFLVASGVDEALDRIAAWELTPAAVDQLVDQLGWPAELLAPLKRQRFTGEVWAVAEGSVVLADEPLLEVTGPLPEAQLVETTVLNAVTYQTALASPTRPDEPSARRLRPAWPDQPLRVVPWPAVARGQGDVANASTSRARDHGPFLTRAPR